LALRVGQTYVYFFCNDRRPTVAGLPLSRKRLRTLLVRLLHECNLDQ
jgi:hypothetical protein